MTMTSVHKGNCARTMMKVQVTLLVASLLVCSVTSARKDIYQKKSCFPTANTTRVLEDLRALRQFGAANSHPLGVSRRAMTVADVQARKWLASKMEQEASMEVHVDSVFTTVGIWRESPASGTCLDERDQAHEDCQAKSAGSNCIPAKTVLMGSHSDTQPQGGWLDGALGVIFALEAARSMKEADCPGSWAVANWQDEEGRFGELIGSKSFIGEDGLHARSELEEACKEFGRQLGDAIRHDQEGMPEWGAYLEAHIEQGQRLEVANQKVGIVSGLVGLQQRTISVTGEQNHAGSTPMDLRVDAFKGIMGFLEDVDQMFRTLSQGRDTVWTFGQVQVRPNVPSVIPGEALASVQFRDISQEHLKLLDEKLIALIDEYNNGSRIPANGNGKRPQFSASGPYTVQASLMAPDVQAHILSAAKEILHDESMYRTMPSGAIHDAGPISKQMPSGMLFVPSINGVSHTFDENTSDEDISIGAQVFVNAAGRLVNAAAEESDRNC